MSSLAAFANLDVDKLITDIASRPAIWDKNFNGRQNKGFLEDTWDELVSIDYIENILRRSRTHFSNPVFLFFFSFLSFLHRL
jgi:hypothetical protein